MSGLLEAIGLVTLRRHQLTIKQLRDAESRTKKLEAHLNEIQARAKAQLEQQVTESRAQSKAMKTEIADAAKALSKTTSCRRRSASTSFAKPWSTPTVVAVTSRACSNGSSRPSRSSPRRATT